MWIDFDKTLAFMLSSEVVNVVLLIVRLHLVKASQDLTAINRAWVAAEQNVSPQVLSKQDQYTYQYT